MHRFYLYFFPYFLFLSTLFHCFSLYSCKYNYVHMYAKEKITFAIIYMSHCYYLLLLQLLTNTFPPWESGCSYAYKHAKQTITCARIDKYFTRTLPTSYLTVVCNYIHAYIVLLAFKRCATSESRACANNNGQCTTTRQCTSMYKHTNLRTYCRRKVLRYI